MWGLTCFEQLQIFTQRINSITLVLLNNTSVIEFITSVIEFFSVNTSVIEFLDQPRRGLRGLAEVCVGSLKGGLPEAIWSMVQP